MYQEEWDVINKRIAKDYNEATFKYRQTLQIENKLHQAKNTIH